MAIMANQTRPVVLEVLNHLQTEQLEGRFVQSVQSQARLAILASRNKQEITYSSPSQTSKINNHTSHSWSGTLINYGTKALVAAGLFFIAYKMGQKSSSMSHTVKVADAPKPF